MSYYYNYYVGQRNKETGKFTTVAPYDADGKPMCLLWKSRSYASDLHEDFTPIFSKKMEDKLKSFGCFVPSSMADDARRLVERLDKVQSAADTMAKSLKDARTSSEKLNNRIQKISDGYVEEDNKEKYN